MLNDSIECLTLGINSICASYYNLWTL